MLLLSFFFFFLWKQILWKNWKSIGNIWKFRLCVSLQTMFFSIFGCWKTIASKLSDLLFSQNSSCFFLVQKMQLFVTVFLNVHFHWFFICKCILCPCAHIVSQIMGTQNIYHTSIYKYFLEFQKGTRWCPF